MEIRVSVSKDKKDKMRDFLNSNIRKNFVTIDFYHRKEILDEVTKLTRDIMLEQEKTFDQAIGHLDKDKTVSVVLDSEVTQLIEGGIKLQQDIMKSYM